MPGSTPLCAGDARWHRAARWWTAIGVLVASCNDPGAPGPLPQRGGEHLESIPVSGAIFVGNVPAGSRSVPVAKPTPSPGATGNCPVFQPARATGRVASPELDELSGLVAGRNNPGVLWVHNDSGDGPRLFALRSDGSLVGRFTLPVERAVDWEDIAIGPGGRDKTPHLYIGDIGDNALRRDEGVVIHRIAEPTLPSAAKAPVERKLGPVESFRLQYPDRPHDAETLLVEPTTGEVVILTKALLRAPRIFYAPSLNKPVTKLQGGQPMDLRALNAFVFLPTAGDVSPDGRWVIVRSYTAAYLWQRDPSRPLHETFQGPSCEVPLAPEPQGESLGFAADGQGYFTVSEKAHQPLFHHALGSTGAKPTSGVRAP